MSWNRTSLLWTGKDPDLREAVVISGDRYEAAGTRRAYAFDQFPRKVTRGAYHDKNVFDRG